MRKPSCYIKEGTNKQGSWSKEEDQKLIDYIKMHGEGCWHALPKAAGLDRCGKSCRLRWINYLRPDIKRGNFTQEEEELVIKLHALLGNRWSLIAGRLPGRTDNEVKNYWNTHMRKKLIRMGIDPNNHKLHHLPRRQLAKQKGIYPLAYSSNNEPKTENGDDISTFESQGYATNDQSSSDNNAINCMNEETSRLLDLNLDLAIVIPLDNPV